MSGTTKAFARVKIDALLMDAGWNLTDGSSILFEYTLPDGTLADYVLCDRRDQPDFQENLDTHSTPQHSASFRCLASSSFFSRVSRRHGSELWFCASNLSYVSAVVGRHSDLYSPGEVMIDVILAALP